MKNFLNDLKRHILTAISYMLPLVVASGLLIAIGNLTGGEVIDDIGKLTIPNALTTLGVLGMGLLPSFIAGYTSYSISDRPGIAPGFLMGQIASFLGAGFLGGIIGGLISGYISKFIIETLKVPKWAEALMPMLIVPTLTSIIAGLIMFFIIGQPIARMTSKLTYFIKNLDRTSKLTYGFIIGFLGCLDYGGPISKVPNLICDGLLLEGIFEPEAIKVLAAMVPPIGVALSLIRSKLINKKIYNDLEVENIKIAFPMGLCMISEGVIPIAMNDLVRTVICTSIGCGITGAFSYSMNVGSPVPSGGIFVIPAMTNPLMALMALLLGSFVTSILLIMFKKRIIKDSNIRSTSDSEEDIDFMNIDIMEG